MAASRRSSLDPKAILAFANESTLQLDEIVIQDENRLVEAKAVEHVKPIETSRTAEDSVPNTTTTKSSAKKAKNNRPFTAPVRRVSTVTKPISPQFRLEKRIKDHQRPIIAPSDQVMMNKLQEDIKREKLNIEKAQRMYAQLKKNGFRSAAKVEVPVMAKKITIPKTPVSILDKRKGKKVPSNPKKSPPQVSSKAAKKNSGPLELTVPVPFNFTTDTRMRSTLGSTMNSVASIDKNAGMTAGELAQKFMQDSRSHHVPVHVADKLTVAHSPKFRTEIRCKSANRSRPMSHIEQEDLEMKEFQSRPFRAREIDRRIFDSRGEIGVPKIMPKPLTEPVEFDLQYEKRAQTPRMSMMARANSKEAIDISTAFKARPMPMNMKQPPKPLPVADFKKLTQPESPKLHGNERASSAPARRQKPHHAQVEEERRKRMEEEKKFCDKRLTLTEPQEFDLKTTHRSAHYQAVIEEQLEKEKEEERLQREIKALPMPDLTQTFKTQKSDKQVTNPEPFLLESVARHEESQAMLQQSVEQALQHKTSFKAKPLPKTTYEPDFSVVIDENRPPHVVPVNVQLESDVRAMKRKEFNESIAEKMQQMEDLKAQLAQRKAEQEEHMIKQLRRKSVLEGGMAFKAAPILNQSHLQEVKNVVKATKPLQMTKQKSASSQEVLQSKTTAKKVASFTGASVKGKPNVLASMHSTSARALR